jgi:threonine synthase
MMLGCPGIYIKDERQGPTASFKDRQAALTIAALKEAGITELVAASTGNVAISYSAYAARAGIKLWAFVTSLVPAVKMREIALYGSQVVKVTGSYDQVKQIAAEFAQKRGLYHDMGTRTITSVEGMKTIAYEVSEQLTEQLGPPKDTPPGKLRWRTPDWYIQSVSGGLGPVGVAKGYKEMIQMGFTDRLPGIIAVQAEGCAPMVHAWKDDLEEAIPVTNPKTHIETLATGTPGRSYGLLRKQMKEHGGLFESVTDEEAFRAMHVLAKMEGISAEPASAVAFAGLFKLIRAGVIKPTDTVVVNCTGHTMPAEPLVLGSGWARNVVLPQVEKVEAQRDTEEEGLLAALSRVAPDRFPRVAIIDDTADARRLVRRILQSQGDFTIFEASSGREGLELVKREHPDLLILDLMMPEMDGFSVLDALKANPDTAEIPVIVSTAKELTIEEKNRLQGQIQALMQKGDFMSDEFLEEVKALLK